MRAEREQLRAFEMPPITPPSAAAERAAPPTPIRQSRHFRRAPRCRAMSDDDDATPPRACYADMPRRRAVFRHMLLSAAAADYLLPRCADASMAPPLFAFSRRAAAVERLAPAAAPRCRRDDADAAEAHALPAYFASAITPLPRCDDADAYAMPLSAAFRYEAILRRQRRCRLRRCRAIDFHEARCAAAPAIV